MVKKRNESAFSEIDCEVKRGNPCGYQILLNGVDVSDHVTEFSYKITGTSVPSITIRIPVRSFKSNVKAIFKREICINGKMVKKKKKAR